LWADGSTGSGLSRRRGVGDAAAPFFFCGEVFLAAAAFGVPIFLGAAFLGLEGSLGMIDLEKWAG
jgi:hypothetical protein